MRQIQGAAHSAATSNLKAKSMWQFRKTDQRKWYWRELDDVGDTLRRSTQLFKERIDCIVHAMQHGYVHPRQRALVRIARKNERR